MGDTRVEAHGQVPGAPTKPGVVKLFGLTKLWPWTVGPCIVGVVGFESGGAIISGAFGIAPGRGAVTPGALGVIPCAIADVLIPRSIANMTDLTNIRLSIMNSLL